MTDDEFLQREQTRRVSDAELLTGASRGRSGKLQQLLPSFMNFALFARVFVSLNSFCVVRAQTRPQRTRPMALWRAGLLLCFLGLCACVGEMTRCLVMHVTHRENDLPETDVHLCVSPVRLTVFSPQRRSASSAWSGGQRHFPACTLNY